MHDPGGYCEPADLSKTASRAMVDRATACIERHPTYSRARESQIGRTGFRRGRS
jgi:hypothetical protein